MAARRMLGILVVALISVRPGLAQTYPLSETIKAGDCFQIHLETNVTGEMRVRQGEQLVGHKIEMSAVHDFPERILSLAGNGLPDKTARVYEKAKAAHAVAGDQYQRILRPERNLCVAQRNREQTTVYCPSGPLVREEIEVTEHFDTLALPGLLAGKEVAVGATWTVPNPVVQVLCGFEGLTEHNLICKVEAVNGQIARVSVSGPTTGIDQGALVKLTVDASYLFDLTIKRLTRLEWKQKEERNQGPVSPAATLEATTVLTRTPIDQPASLSDNALLSVPDGQTPAPLLQLEYQDARSGFRIRYDREWQSVSQTPEHTVWRLMEQGDFVAQVTISPWSKAEKGKHLSPDEFTKAMAETPGWDPQDQIQSEEVPASDGRWIYRISAVGEQDGIKVMQNFFLVAGPDGQQVVLAFTMAPKEAKRMGTRDVSLALNLEFLQEGEKPK